jgi:MoxR-like ATPase
MASRLNSPEDVQALVRNTTSEVARAVVGYESTIFDILVAVSVGGHVLVEGVPGIAKTTLTKSLARAMDIAYGRIQFTQDLLPADITGHSYFNQETRKFELRKGPIFTELLLADEVNRAPPKTQSALLEGMQERQVTIEGTTLQLPDLFTVLATLNPVETEGVYPLPEAQLDRFMVKLKMDYPDETDETAILTLKSNLEEFPRSVMSRDDIVQMRKLAFDVYSHSSIITYVREIARASREVDDVELGLSPRGGLHLLQMAKGRALLSGRSYVIPDDVKAMAHKVMDHRLISTPEAELEGQGPGVVTETVLAKVPVPKEDFGSARKELK